MSTVTRLVSIFVASGYNWLYESKVRDECFLASSSSGRRRHVKDRVHMRTLRVLGAFHLSKTLFCVLHRQEADEQT